MLKRRWKISNSIWAELRDRSAIWASIVPARARWDDASVSQTPIKSDGETDRGIIDRQEKGSLLPLCLIIEKEKREREGAAGRRRSEGVIACNMLPRANSHYMKCLACAHDFGPQAPTGPRKDNESLEMWGRGLNYTLIIIMIVVIILSLRSVFCLRRTDFTYIVKYFYICDI